MSWYGNRKRRRRSSAVSRSPQSKRAKSGPEDGTLEVDPAPSLSMCQFCLSSEDNEAELGPMLEKDDITVHYFCLLLSSGLHQRTKPSNKSSILGFTVSDIKTELHRGTRLKCVFCRKMGATIGCSNARCRKSFHLRCGRQNGTMHTFFGNYESYCAKHVQPFCWDTGILSAKLTSHVENSACLICMMPIGKCQTIDVLLPPCCKRSHFHHACIQRHALSAGKSHFRCPLCNNCKKFQKGMRMAGIFIPDRDASWEREANAFQELLERPDTCVADPCLCSQGKKHSEPSGLFQLLTCSYCGSDCAHRACAGITSRLGAYICNVCRLASPSKNK